MQSTRLPREFLEEQLAKLTPASYNPYYWHRRYKSKKRLEDKYPLYEKIAHGDYDHSEYYYQSEYETYLMEDKLNSCKNAEQSHEARGLFMERKRKLSEDYEKDEAKIMQKLKTDFVKTFKINRTELENIMEDFEGNLLDLYNHIKIISNGRQNS
jgi:hypothetical protein